MVLVYASRHEFGAATFASESVEFPSSVMVWMVGRPEFNLFSLCAGGAETCLVEKTYSLSGIARVYVGYTWLQAAILFCFQLIV